MALKRMGQTVGFRDGINDAPPCTRPMLESPSPAPRTSPRRAEIILLEQDLGVVYEGDGGRRRLSTPQVYPDGE